MNVENILKTGTLVEIEYPQPDGNSTKLNTLIDYPLKDGYFTIYAPMIKGAVFPMRENEHLWIIFMTDNAEKTDKDVYKIKCRVEQRGYTNGIAVYKLFKTTNPEKVQRRGAFRLPILKDFTMIVGEEHRLVHITTVNISGTGLKAVTNEKIDSGSMVILNLDTELEVLQIPSKVVVCNKQPDSNTKYDLRLQFVIDKDAISQKLNAYLFKKQSEVIQKNLDPLGYSESYYKLYDKDKYDPEKELGNKRSNVLLLAAFVLTLCSLFAMYVAVPKDPITIFKTLLKMNIAYNAWNYQFLMISMILSACNSFLCGAGLVIKRRFHLSNQMPVHVPFLGLLLVNLFLLINGVINYF